MDYNMGFTIIGLHHSRVMSKLDLHDDPLTPHDTKQHKRSKAVISLDGWEISFSWGKSQYWDPAGYKAKKQGNIMSVPVKPYANNSKNQQKAGQGPKSQEPNPETPSDRKCARSPSLRRCGPQEGCEKEESESS